MEVQEGDDQHGKIKVDFIHYLALQLNLFVLYTIQKYLIYFTGFTFTLIVSGGGRSVPDLLLLKIKIHFSWIYPLDTMRG